MTYKIHADEAAWWQGACSAVAKTHWYRFAAGMDPELANHALEESQQADWEDFASRQTLWQLAGLPETSG